MINIFDVAKYILRSIGGEISTIKLQNLCYYSQAWSLVWENKALFEEDFYCSYGFPVCKELFDGYKGKFLVKASGISNRLCSKNDFSIDNIRDIDQIIEDYGKFDGGTLGEYVKHEVAVLGIHNNLFYFLLALLLLRLCFLLILLRYFELLHSPSKLAHVYEVFYIVRYCLLLSLYHVLG